MDIETLRNNRILKMQIKTWLIAINYGMSEINLSFEQ